MQRFKVTTIIQHTDVLDAENEVEAVKIASQNLPSFEFHPGGWQWKDVEVEVAVDSEVTLKG